MAHLMRWSIGGSEPCPLMSTTYAWAADLRNNSNAIAHRTILPVFGSGREHLSTSQIIPNAVSG